jgi:hypothetical protein
VIPAAVQLGFVLYGDSYAAQYHAALQERFGSGALISEPSCLAAEGVSNQPPGAAAADCLALPEKLITLVKQRGIRTIFWAQRWEQTLYAPGQPEPLGDTSDRGAPAFLRALERTADRLPEGTTIVLIGNAPAAWVAGPMMEKGWLRCHAYLNTACPDSFPAERAEGRAANTRLRDFARTHARFVYVDAEAPFCQQGRCLLVQGGTLNIWDDSHLTLAGARRVVGSIDPLLLQAGEDRSDPRR